MAILNFFKDKSGKFVIIQSPNLPLVVAFIFYILTLLELQSLSQLGIIGLRVSLSYWAFLEMGWGDSPFRRVLGAFVFLSLFF